MLKPPDTNPSEIEERRVCFFFLLGTGFHYVLVSALLVSVALGPASAQPRATFEQIQNSNIDSLLDAFRQAKGTSDEAVATAQVTAAFANQAAAGNMRALSLLRQLQTVGEFQSLTTRWPSTGADGTAITCIVSATTTQIIWKMRYAEMNPSVGRWTENCVYSSPRMQTESRLIVARIKRSIDARLRDPEGTRYRNVRLWIGGFRVVLCGEINMRNGFGGFNGYGRFIARTDMIEFPYGDLGEVRVVEDWPTFCTISAGFHDMGPIELSK